LTQDGRSAFGGKERALAGLAVLFVEDTDGLLPGGALGVVDLAQVEDVPLRHAAPDAAALDNRPGAMLLAVLLSGAALEKHAASVALSRRMRRGKSPLHAILRGEMAESCGNLQDDTAKTVRSLPH